ncbi:hypothetical protein GEMRC1_008001 [Eukaryota sp. GEM-RC1]
MVSSRSLYQLHVQQARTRETQDQSYSNYVNSHYGTVSNCTSEDRVEYLRRCRQQQEIEHERRMYETLKDAELKKIQSQQLRHQEEALALELAKEKRKTEAEQRFRQKLRQESEELRELEAKLKDAQMIHEVQSQIDHRRQVLENEKLEVHEQDERIRKHIEEERKREQDEAWNNRLCEFEHKQVLADQINQKRHIIKAEEEEQKKAEDSMVRAIMDRILNEDRKMKEKEAKKQEENAEVPQSSYES